MKVSVDGRLCTGHQMCAIAAPEVFGSDDYGNAVVLIPGDLPPSSSRRRGGPKETARSAPSPSRTDSTSRTDSIQD